MALAPSQVIEYAHALLNAHGSKAEAEAAQKARALGVVGQADQADDWHAIRRAIHEMRDVHQA